MLPFDNESGVVRLGNYHLQRRRVTPKAMISNGVEAAAPFVIYGDDFGQPLQSDHFLGQARPLSLSQLCEHMSTLDLFWKCKQSHAPYC